jgi:hypothetical protein
MSPNEARRAIEQVSYETQRDLVAALRFDAAVLRSELQSSAVAAEFKRRADELMSRATEADARISDADLRSQFEQDVTDVVCAIRTSSAYQSAGVPPKTHADDPAAPPLPASYLAQGGRRR